MDASDASALPAGKAARTRRRILDAAAHVLAARGAVEPTLGDIAAEAGLKAGSLYFHFGSKDEILAEVLSVGIIHSLGHLRAAVETAGPEPAGRLRAAMRAHLSARHELSDYARVLLGVAMGPEPLDQRSAGLRRDYLDDWSRLIRDAQADRALPGAPDARLLRDLILGALNVDLRDRWSVDDAEAAVVELIGLERAGRHPGPDTRAGFAGR